MVGCLSCSQYLLFGSFYPPMRANCFFVADLLPTLLQTNEYDEYFSEIDAPFRTCSPWTFVCAARGQRTSASIHTPAALCSVQRMEGWMDIIPLDFGSPPVCCTCIRAGFVHGLHFSLLRHWFLPSPALACVLSEAARADEDGWGVCVSPCAWGWIHNDSEGTLPAAISALTPPFPTSAAHIWLLGNRCSFDALWQRILSKRLGGQRRSVLCLLLLAS